MQHIMVAHDLSTTAQIALQRGVQLAQQHQARLSVIYVLEDHLPMAVLEKQMLAADALLTQQLRDCHAENAQVLIKMGRPAQTIVAAQKAHSVDFMVMGDHHQDSAEYFSGTTLERVLQRSAVPVLLAIEPSASPYQRALVPLDFSLCACHALHHVFKLLPKTAFIHALHVLEMAEVHGADSDAEITWQASLFDQLVMDERAKLPEAGPQISHELRQGELHNCLAQVIAEQQPQILAIGKHGRGVLADALLGSLAQHFLEYPPCDVLVVK
ncbi:MAG: universal stress protein [Gammaproteobacteria bacterium]|jgi:nucleotide-binding universal stress UspA family protein|nr:universal stress protein [Pseudomonas sp.]MDY0413818.1 universal stress protein [Pseudomonas sp.]NLO54224.1 universal stress protein [Gammaproteobacteria bacterium]